MKKDEKRFSKIYAKQLTLTKVEDFGGKMHYLFVDKYGTIFEHWQIEPQFCENDKAAARAKEFLTKVGKLNIGDKVYCHCRIRLMKDGNSYRDVDKIICKI